MVVAGIYAVVMCAWFRPGQLILFWDQTYPLAPFHDVVGTFHAWHRDQAFGPVNTTGHALLALDVAVLAFDLVFVDPSLAQAMLFGTLWLFSLMGWFLVIRTLLRESAPAAGRASVSLASACGCLAATVNSYAVFYLWRIVIPPK